MSRKAILIRIRDKIFTVFQTESAPPPLEPNCTTHAEQDGFHRFMEEYAKQQGTDLEYVVNESASPDIQAATPRSLRRL